MKTAILIPCYNEAKTIEKIVTDFKNFMVHDIKSDCYIMVDGDDTYPAEHAKKFEKLILSCEAVMVIGDRLSSTYFEENGRLFHNTCNRVVRKFKNIFFKSNLNDIMMGMVAFSYNFVKSFPIQSKIETEMSISTLINNFKIKEIPVDYGDRIEGHESKLNTYCYDYKVIRMIFTLIRDEKTLFFFSVMTLTLLIIASIYFLPILFKYFLMGYVLIPTLIMISTGVVCGNYLFYRGYSTCS